MTRRLFADRRGQSAALFALLLPLLIALAGLAVDLGWFLHHKMKIQNAADLSALSAAQHLPEDPGAAYATAEDIFEANYGMSVPISNVNFFNGNRGVKVHYEMQLPLLFMRLLGLESASVSGKAEAAVEFLHAPTEIIPIAIFHTQPLNYGQRTVIYGDNSTVGNFGIVDLSRGAITEELTLNEAITAWIAHGFSTEDGAMPKSGEKIPTVTGKRTGPVDRGFDIRIAEGRTTVICPVADFSKAKSSSQVPILGFAMFEAVSSDLRGTGANETVDITGVFVEFVDPSAVTDPGAGAYGVKTVLLVK